MSSHRPDMRAAKGGIEWPQKERATGGGHAAPRRWRHNFAARGWLVPGATLVALVVALGLLGGRYVPLLSVAEEWAEDFIATMFRRFAPQRDDIVLLTIRESTLARFPFRSPIERGFLAELVDTLNERGARAIGLDILFDQPTLPDADTAFLAAARRSRVPVIVGWTDRLTSLTAAQYGFQQSYLGDLRAGFVNIVRDRGGTVRDAFPGREEESGWRDSFPFALAAAVGIAPRRDAFRIDYLLGPDLATPPFRAWPAETLRLLPAAWFRDKIVLVGADLPFEDRVRTPFASSLGIEQGTLPGVTVHAHVLAQLLDGRHKPVADWVAEAAVLVILSLLAIALAVWIEGTLRQLLAATLVVALFWSTVAALYWRAGIYVPLASPTLAFSFATFVGVAFVGHRRSLQGKFVRQAFAHYVSPSIIERLEANPDQLGLGGDKREISVLFTDVEGFTSFAERQEPTVLIGILNRYLDALSAEVQRCGGTIDKFIGDAVMALFGAPEAQPDHGERAVACALGIRDVSRRLQLEFAAEGMPFGRTRIGIHSGLAVVGNVGGEERFDYTAIGDVVNTASRLEGANKYFGTDICASGATRDASPHRPFRPIGSLVVKGRTETLPVFSPVAIGQEAEAESYNAAYCLIDQDGQCALVAFETHLARYPDDRLAEFHLSRLSEGVASTRIVLEAK